jgi:hypothetical protein
MRAVADRLDSLGLDYAFVGGSIVNLLLDNPALLSARPTDDVDGRRPEIVPALHNRAGQDRSDLLRPATRTAGLGMRHSCCILRDA